MEASQEDRLTAETAAEQDSSDIMQTNQSDNPQGRSHSTVHLCQMTLQFESKALEERYRAYSRLRWRRLFLRSLLPSALFQILFCFTDYILFPARHLEITIPARVLLVALQSCLFCLAKLNLVVLQQRMVLAATLLYGLTSLSLFALQREALSQMDGLYVVFGLAFYAVPKVSPLTFMSSFVGSWIAVVWYLVMAVYFRPPSNSWETVFAILYVVPVVAVFNLVMYHYECSARERFVLRDRLSQERITIAVSRTGASSQVQNRQSAVLIGILLWLLLTAAGWASIHDVLLAQLKVEKDTAWAWFSHCAGLSVFMLMVTRQTRWLFVFPIMGALVLWGMTQAIPEPWIVLSAHGVGYSLLALVAVMAMGVFGHFMAAWNQLVAFLQRTCLLYPQLQAGLHKDFPLLETIVKDYTSALNPKSWQTREDQTNVVRSLKQPPQQHCQKKAEDDLSSVLLTSKPDVCFFCSKAGAVHFVPCCAAWGPHAQWRLEISQQIANGTFDAKVMATPPAQMCTPYSTLQLKLKQTEVDLQLAVWERQDLERKLAQAKAANYQVQAALQETQQSALHQSQVLQQQLMELDRQWAQRLEAFITDSNRTLHENHEALKAMERRLAIAEAAAAAAQCHSCE